MNWKHVSCSLCGADNPKKIVKCNIEDIDSVLPVDYMTISKCRSCGLVYVADRPELSREELKSAYSKKYFSAPYMEFYLKGAGVQSNESYSYRLKKLEKYKSQGKLLDIGCAAGGFMDAASRRGWKVYGVEVSDDAARRAEKKFPGRIHKGKIEDAEFKAGYFDAVTAGDVMEHVRDPVRFLKEIYRILKPGGILYLAVPDFSGLYYRLAVRLSRVNGKNYFVLPHHIYFFTGKTLSGLLSKTGFKSISRDRKNSKIMEQGIKRLIMQLLSVISVITGLKDRAIVIAERPV